MDLNFEWRTREEKKEVVRFWWRQQRALCHICGGEMEPYSQAIVSPWAATIEHLVPRRENGPNTVGNVRLAHRWCNNALGALWELNRHRSTQGLPPLSEKWALSNAVAQVRQRRIAKPVEPERLPKGSYGCSMAAMMLRGEMPLPRGATLSASRS